MSEQRSGVVGRWPARKLEAISNCGYRTSSEFVQTGWRRRPIFLHGVSGGPADPLRAARTYGYACQRHLVLRAVLLKQTCHHRPFFGNLNSTDLRGDVLLLGLCPNDIHNLRESHCPDFLLEQTIKAASVSDMSWAKCSGGMRSAFGRMIPTSALCILIPFPRSDR